MHYTMTIAGLERDLELFPVNDDLQIAAFIMFGDVEIAEATAKALYEMAPEFDVILTPEAKCIPMVHEFAKLAGINDYVVARKVTKVYMKNCICSETESITTKGKQKLYLGENDVNKMRGKRILIVDDVISTGGSLLSLEALVEAVGGEIAGKMFVLAEGDACKRDDVTFLHRLPLFDAQGNPIE